MEGKAYPDSNQYHAAPQYPENPPPYAGLSHPQGPPPPPGMHPPGPVILPPSLTVVPTIVVSPMVGPQPTRMTCRSCGAEIVTRVEHNATTKTHVIALLLCLFGCWPCVCIPYCVDSCQNADHYCPNCNSYIGGYSN